MTQAATLRDWYRSRRVLVTGHTGFKGSWLVAWLRQAGADLPEPRVLVSAEDVREGKPSPDGYLRAAELLGVPPSACLVLEDAPAGIEAARAAGTIVVALSTTHPASSLAGARLLLGSLADVHLIGSPSDGRPLSLELDAASVIPA